MVDIEALTMQAMGIVTYAGMAKSSYINALKCAKKHETEEAGKLLKEGDSMLAQAHESHMGLLQKEAESLEPQVCLMIVHGEDQLMSCETIRLLVTELMEIYGNQ
ncbi:PTS lactose/cellobiose transporter subunit IIA [Lacrimispora sp. 210928-DFI.3.58]|uniref:PTS lactose/cellobiose transporter subunit IIA n=1 Tax=Lacrimispora sp. 210928-DFI.3.58 TaxID=2883214 RepID=UPI0015B4D19D|nr:PTS lactose/cellobiose transporter subunit IIA [Lacrimispora sp. 210928-DFI.3.58]MCB7320664.1 PTS lactose/cellobiose transporter subunit IIA [Lacrimispora sp. 210928-DFI.3.58]